MSARRRLIVAADDFGMSAGINAAILRAHREGILTETSVMVGGAAAQEAVAMARATPTLGVGLHLALLQGHAAAPAHEVPLLVDPSGRFSDSPVWTGVRYFFVPGIRDQLRREITAQLDAFAATGLPLSHVDGHLTIHMHPCVLAVLLDVAPRYGLRALRVPREPLGAALRWDRRHAARKVFEAMAFRGLVRWGLPRIAAAGLHAPDHMFGMHQTGAVTEDYLLHLIDTLPPGTSEVYCHPAIVDDEARRWRPAEYRSEAELDALCSPRVRAAIAAAGIELIRYRDL